MGSSGHLEIPPTNTAHKPSWWQKMICCQCFYFKSSDEASQLDSRSSPLLRGIETQNRMGRTLPGPYSSIDSDVVADDLLHSDAISLPASIGDMMTPEPSMVSPAKPTIGTYKRLIGPVISQDDVETAGDPHGDHHIDIRGTEIVLSQYHIK